MCSFKSKLSIFFYSRSADSTPVGRGTPLPTSYPPRGLRLYSPPPPPLPEILDPPLVVTVPCWSRGCCSTHRFRLRIPQCSWQRWIIIIMIIIMIIIIIIIIIIIRRLCTQCIVHWLANMSMLWMDPQSTHVTVLDHSMFFWVLGLNIVDKLNF